MMKKKKVLIITAVVFLMLISAGVGAYAATNYGTSSNPLVTVSYLDNVLKKDLLADMQTQVEAAVKKLESSNETGAFAVVSLASGQTLNCSAGCEVLPRSGALKASAALADSTDGATVAAGTTLSANHLYVVTVGTGFTGIATLLVKGDYTVS